MKTKSKYPPIKTWDNYQHKTTRRVARVIDIDIDYQDVTMRDNKDDTVYVIEFADLFAEWEKV